MTVHVRPAELRDAPRVAALSGQLGYELAPDQAARRLDRFLSAPAHGVFVAAFGDDVAVGWVHVGVRDVLEAVPRAEILGLVVDEAARASGIGRALVHEAEAWALARGLAEVVVRSNVTRELSHPFYLHLGYAATKTQHVYRKTLTVLPGPERDERVVDGPARVGVHLAGQPWEPVAIGARQKAFERDGKRVRLLEMTEAFVDSASGVPPGMPGRCCTGPSR